MAYLEPPYVYYASAIAIVLLVIILGGVMSLAFSSPFRRFVIGIVLVFQLAFVVGATLVGAWGGYIIAELAIGSPYGTPSAAYDVSIPFLQFIGIILGAMLGFMPSATSAALLYLLVEIQNNTRETARSQKHLRRRTFEPPVEPQLRRANHESSLPSLQRQREGHLRSSDDANT